MNSTKLYGGSVNVEFFDEWVNPKTNRVNKHVYLVNGERCPISVTSVTGLLDKPALKIWAANMARDFLLEAFKNGLEITEGMIIESAKAHTKKTEREANSGTAVHKWAEEFIHGNNPEMPKDDRVKKGAMAFVDWVESENVKFVASEQIVYSKKYHFVGVADAIAKIKNKLYLIDFKTSGAIHAEFFMQTAAYLNADREESERKYEGAKIVRFDKDTGEFEIRERNMLEVDQDYQAFVGLLQAKKWTLNQ